ncbi:hypothetical protein AVEN_85573-1 [Araneus ventricosus]|uniref:MBD domain-containing protein n=1 Tax=Araneus ventricosus TaxID=182803 RepID=A0A4Y2P6C5_ARAVE|nr:hypothetical protein AVEN_85573-1 [Araneus ventricosus]
MEPYNNLPAKPELFHWGRMIRMQRELVTQLCRASVNSTIKEHRITCRLTAAAFGVNAPCVRALKLSSFKKEDISRSEERKKVEFDHQKSKALATIYLSLEESQKDLVAEAETAKEVWTLLGEIYKSKSRARIAQLRKQIDKVSESHNTSKIGNIELWHSRFGHQYVQDLIKMSKHKSDIRLENLKGSLEYCDICKVSKLTKKPSKELLERTTSQPLELIHMGVWGPSPIKSKSGVSYCLSIIDDYTRKVHVYVMHNKKNVFKYFLQFQAMTERQLNRKIGRIRTDNVWKETIGKTHKRYGCLAFAYVPKAHRNKLQNRSRPGVFIGYTLKTVGYRIWYPDEDKADKTKHVFFNESKIEMDSFPNKNDSTSTATFMPELVEEHLTIEEKGLPVEESTSSIEWKRVTKKREKGKTAGRVDVYYYPKPGVQLRSLKEVKNYCDNENINFYPK